MVSPINVHSTNLPRAVSSQNMALVDFLLSSSADLQNEAMVQETPLQVNYTGFLTVLI